MKTMQQIIRIGEWEVLPRTNQVQNKEASFFLKPLLMRLLVLLLQHSNRIIPKEELMEVIWEDRIVTDNLLAKSISELRQIIQRNFPELMQIETIRSVGYVLRCYSPIVFKEEAQKKANTVNLDRALNLPRQQSLLFSLLFAFGLVGLFTFFFLQFTQMSSKNSEKPYQVKFSPVTSKLGMEWQAAISPEGANLVYAWRRAQGEPFYLYTRHLESSIAKRLTNQKSWFELNPVWSPDGQKIAFLRGRKEGGYRLQLIPLAGGEEETIAEFDFFVIKPTMLWMAKPNSLIFSAKKDRASALSLFGFNLDNRQFQQLTFPSDTIYGDHFPNLLPNGKIAFARSNYGKSLLNTKASGKGKIILIDLKEGKKRQLADFHGELTGMVYSKPLKKLMVWLTKKEGFEYVMQGYQINGVMEKITEVHSFRPSNLWAHPQSPFLLYEAWSSLLNINVLENNELQPFFHSTHWDYHPRFAEDNQKVIFLSSRNGPLQVWLGEKNYPDRAIPISSFESRSIHWMSFSPDANTVLLQGNIEGQEGIYKLNVKNKKLTPLKIGTYAHPEFSLDGQSVYYASKQSGDWQIWRCNLVGKEEEIITKNGGYKASPLHNSDGDFIIYTPFKKTGLWKMDLHSRQTEKIFSEEEPFDKMNYAVTNDGIYYLQWQQDFCYLKYFDFVDQVFRVIAPLEGIVPGIPGLAVGTDGTILITQSDKINADLWKAEIGR